MIEVTRVGKFYSWKGGREGGDRGIDIVIN